MRERLAAMSVFAQVVEANSFSGAAIKLGLSKSLVSREVSALERSLAVKLLNRSTRRLSLTEAGAIFYEHCRRIVH
jgi:DNA-binding transcriptional LysR family regulator